MVKLLNMLLRKLMTMQR